MSSHNTAGTASTLANTTKSRTRATRLNVADHRSTLKAIADALSTLELSLWEEAEHLRRTYRDRQGITGEELAHVAARAQQAVGHAASAVEDTRVALNNHLTRMRKKGIRVSPHATNALLSAAKKAHHAMSAATGWKAAVRTTQEHVEVLTDLSETAGHFETATRAMAEWVGHAARYNGGDHTLTRAADQLAEALTGAATQLRTAKRLVRNLSEFQFDGGSTAARNWPTPR